MKKTTGSTLSAAALVAAGIYCGIAHVQAAGTPPAGPFKDAVKVWHFAGTDGLEATGAAKTGVKLDGADRAASLARGGDGMVAEMDGGYFVASGDAKVTGKQMTLLLRLRDPKGAWDSPLLARQDPSDPLANLLYCVDGRQKPRDYYWTRDGEVKRFGATPYFHLFHESGDDRAIREAPAILEYRWRTEPVPEITGRSKSVPGEVGEQAGGAYLPLCAPLAMVGLDAWHDVVIRFDGPNLEMYIDGVLIDEEWPWGGLHLMETPFLIGAGYENGKIKSGFRGQIDHMAIWDRALSEDEIVALSGGPKHVAHRDLEILGPIAPSPQYWRPRGYNTYAGDVMMLTRDGRMSVFYLFDRRHHTSKWNLGAHQYAHFSSSNLADWTEHELAIPLDRQWEVAIGTGEFIAHEGVVYCFYTDCGGRCHFPDKPHQGSGIFVATSRDGIHFTKQDGPIVEGGDCSVFRDDQTGLFYLLTNGPEGTVAHVSKDLKRWDPEPKPFFTGASGTCPHWFKWNDCYYLKAGNAFFQSRQPLGPWTPIRSRTLCTRITHVKTAPWKDGRRIGGDWIGDAGWGGDLVIRELVQHDDGNLTWKFLPELIPASGDPLALPFTALGGGASRDGKTIHLNPPSPDEPVFGALDKLPEYFRLTATVRPGKDLHQLGLCVRGDGDYQSGVELRFDPRNRIAGYSTPKASRQLGNFNPLQQDNLKDVKGLDNAFTIDLIATRFGLVDLCINGERCMITRNKGANGSRLFFFADGGSAAFENVVIRPLLDPTPETAMRSDYGLTRRAP
ncbi:MAG: hypothetical protein IT577_07435 [Verrucomicrobiae bacterium]|nr:hypothetical protein [Verrucomicrobiae bacterium]